MKIFLLFLLITFIKSAPIEDDKVENKETITEFDRELDFDIASADPGPVKVNCEKYKNKTSLFVYSLGRSDSFLTAVVLIFFSFKSLAPPSDQQILFSSD